MKEWEWMDEGWKDGWMDGEMDGWMQFGHRKLSIFSYFACYFSYIIHFRIKFYPNVCIIQNGLERLLF